MSLQEANGQNKNLTLRSQVVDPEGRTPSLLRMPSRSW
jgi:hypothetical protein